MRRLIACLTAAAPLACAQTNPAPQYRSRRRQAGRSQISGGDPWTEHENYTVEAKPPDSLHPAITNLRHSWWDISDPPFWTEAFKVMIHDIGLKLVRSEGPVETFVIDHAARPSAN